MSETNGVSFTPFEGGSRGNVGKIMNNIQLKVVDPVTKRTLSANEKGEIFIKTRAVVENVEIWISNSTL